MPETKKPLFPLSRLDILSARLIDTLAPSLRYGGIAEFQTLSYALGMTHASGYPTQIVFGKLFTFPPFGDIAYCVNLMSAFFGALAAAKSFPSPAQYLLHVLRPCAVQFCHPSSGTALHRKTSGIWNCFFTDWSDILA